MPPDWWLASENGSLRGYGRLGNCARGFSGRVSIVELGKGFPDEHVGDLKPLIALQSAVPRSIHFTRVRTTSCGTFCACFFVIRFFL